MSNIATLGLEFNANGATNKIQKLCDKFDELAKKTGSIQTAMDSIFKNLPKTLAFSVKTIDKLNVSLEITRNHCSGINISLANIKKSIADISGKTISPISPTAVANAERMANSINKISISINSMPTNAGTGDVKNLGHSMGYAATQTDGLSIAFRTLQGAVSFNFFKSAAAQAVEFGTELAYIKSIASELDVSQIGTGVMNMSSVLGNASESLKGLYYAYSSGIRGGEEDFLKFTETMRKTAIVNRSSFIPTIDAATAAMNAYNISVDRAGEVADTFFAIVKYGKASGEQLANSLGQVTPTAKTLGVSLDELGASIASLTKIQPTRVAITGLNNMLSKIMKPTKQSRLALQKLGVDMSYSAVQSKGFVAVLEEVRTALNGDAEAIKNIFPDIRGQRAAMHLLGAGWKDFTEQLKNFENKKGSMEDAFKTIEENTAVQLAAIPETMKKIVTEAGNMVTEFVTLGGALTPVIAAFNEMGEGGRSILALSTLLVGGTLAYKAAIAALTTLQAMKIKNEQVIAAQKAQKIAQQKILTSAQMRELAATRLQMRNEILLNKNNAQRNIAIANEIRLAATKHQIRVQELTSLAAEIKLQKAEALARGEKLRAMQLENQFVKLNNLIKASATKASTAENLALKHEAAARLANANAAQIEAAMVKKAALSKTASAIATPIKSAKSGWGAAMAGMGAGLTVIPGAKLLGGVIGAIAPAITKLTMGFGGLNLSLGVTAGKLGVTVGSVKATALASSLLTAKVSALGAAGTAAGVGTATVVATVGGLVVAAGAAGYAVGKLLYKIPGVKRAMDAMGEWMYDFFTGALSAVNEQNRILDQQINFRKRIKESLGGTLDAVSEALSAWQNAGFDTGKSDDKLTKLQEAQKTAQKAAAENTEEKVFLQEQELKKLQYTVSKQNATAAEMAKFNQAVEDGLKGFEKAKEKYISGQRNVINANKALLEYYKAEAEGVEKKIKKNNDLSEKLTELEFESKLDRAKNDAEKNTLYNERAKNLLKQSQDAEKQGNFSASYDYFQKYINYSKKAAQLQNKLAESEKQANQKTLQMILALDKFKVTAMDFIDVNSTEAMKLQSRSFGSLPQFNPLTTRQTEAENLNNAINQRIEGFAKNLQESLQKDTQSQTDKLERSEKLLEQLVNEQNKMVSNLQAIVNKLNRGIDITNMKGKPVNG